VIDDLRAVVRAHESSRPRSMQKAIGPSEAGTECDRRLAYRMLDVDPCNTSSDPWAAIVGTSVHAWLDAAFLAQNERDDVDRWACDVKVTLGDYMRGSVDLYDRKTGTVIDHKVLGATSLKKLKAEGPSEQYRTQVHLYACGLRLAGANVQHVAIAAWSRSGQLKDATYWTEPYDEARVERTLARLDALRSTTDALGTAALPLIHTADAFCAYCPFYLPGVTDVEDACGGHVAGPNPTNGK
jgi:hypothetical protein